MEWLIGLVVLVLAIAGARQMARRKGRNPMQWGVLTFLFFPLLLVLLFLPTRRAEPAVAAVAPAVRACSACGGAVSVQAAACPHCGQPQSQIAVRPWYAIPVEVAGTAVVFASVVWSVWWLSQTGTLGGLPRCDSTLAKSEVNRALANAPIGRVMGISIESFDVIRSDSADDKVMRCSADVTLNNATKHTVAFSFTARDDGSYWIEAKIQD